MKKKIISILLTIVMLIGIIPLGAISAFAEGKGSINITYGCDVGKLYGTYFTGDYDDSVFKITGAPTSNVNFNNITFENITCDEDGACVYIDVDDSTYYHKTSFTFTNCRFINCSTTEDGGVVYVNGVTDLNHVSFVNCTFVNCHADGNGGALYINSTTARVYGENNTFFSGCSAGGNGGALYINGTNVFVYGNGFYSNDNTVISGCTADGNGGGIYMNYGKELDGFLLADNSAVNDGGGICNTANGATISNCRFYRNYAKVDGGGIYLDNGTVENCKFYDNDCGGDGYSLCAYWNETKINNCAFTSAYGENAVYNGTQDKCSFPDKSSYQLTVGNGSQGNPYIIKSTDDWDALHYMALKRQRVVLQDGTTQVFGDEYSLYGKYFRLDANIAVCNTVGEVHDYAPLGGAVLYTSYSEFNGNFDGNGHTVTYVSGIDSDRNGVFGYANSATVKNLTVNGYVGGRNRVGGIFGSTYNCTAENCTNNATVYGTISSLGDTASFIGGIVGHSECSNYIGCINNGKVEGTHEHIGGIAGYSNGDTVNGCTNNGNVVCFQKCGGIVGTAHETDSLINGEHRTPKILNCINHASVTAYNSYAGGLIGCEESAVTVENCIINGTVSAKSYSDAITGYTVTGSSYEQCFYDKEKTVGSSLGTGLSTNAMNGLTADENGNLMPYCVNDYIKENKKSKDGWLRAAFDKNGSLVFVPNNAAIYMDTDGFHHYIENAEKVTAFMDTLGEPKKNSTYYVDETVIRNGRIQILGNVTLVLDDDCCYDVHGGIGLEKGNSLTVYSYSLGERMGSMKAATNQENKGAAAIGGNAAETKDSIIDDTLSVSSEKHDCGNLTVYGGNIEAIAYSENDMYGVGIGGNSLPLQRSYINTNIFKPIDFKTGEETFNGGDGGNVKVYNGNLSVKATGAVGIGGGNGTHLYHEYYRYVITNIKFNGGYGGTFSYYGGTVTVESDLAAFGKGRNGGGDRDDITDPNMTAFTSTKDGVYGALAGDNLSELKKPYNFDDKAFRLNGEKCVQFGKYGYRYTEALNPTCETAGHKAYFLWPEDNLYYEEGGFNVAIGDDYALQAWISEGGDGYIAPLGHDWVYVNENQHKCIHCEKTESHSGTAEECEVCGKHIYYSYSAEAHTFEKKPMPRDIKPLASFDENYTLSGGWYLVHGDVMAAERITCNGDVHLILENGCDFTAINGIALNESVSLSVYAQSFDAEEMGKLTVTKSSEFCAGIGSDDEGSCGNISVYGGNITATGGRHAAGIGSGDKGSCDNISIYGGDITATGGEEAAGIGSGYKGSCVNISICGGDITATGGEEAAGIGSGYKGSCESVAISDYLDITAGADKDSAQPVPAYNGEKYVHTELNTAYKAPTCTQNGHIEFYINEGKYYSDAACTKEITDLASWLKTPETDGGGMIPATGHNWSEAEQNNAGTSTLKTPANCTDNAVYYKVCSVCDEISTTETWAKSGTAKGHSCKNTVNYSENDGIYTVTEECQNCDYTNEYSFTEYDYIAAEKGTYIDTGIKPTDKTRVVMNVYVNGDYEYWFGVWDTDYNKSAFALGNDGRGIYAGYGNQGGTNSNGPLSNGYHTVEMNKNEVYFDGIHYTGIAHTYSSEGFPIQNTLYLFAQNRKGTAIVLNDQNTIHCYGCEIYEGETLVRKFVPCKNSNGASGLLDTVNGVFCENKGIATMTALNDTAQTVAKADATCTENGHIAYYRIGFSYYTDEACTKEITDLALWLKTPETDGGGMLPALGHSWKCENGALHKCERCNIEENHTDDGTGICEICSGTIAHIISAKNGAVISNGLIYGLEPRLESLESYIEVPDGFTLEYDSPVGTGTVVKAVKDSEVYESYTVVIFGDVNNDGVYDGMDAVVVNCIANGLLSEEQVGEAVYMAADCNHDGAINELDVDLLEQAGLLLASIDQSKSEEELQTNSAYVEYLNLIEQNPANEEAQPEQTPSALDKLIAFISDIYAFLNNLINFIKTIFA